MKEIAVVATESSMQGVPGWTTSANIWADMPAKAYSIAEVETLEPGKGGLCPGVGL